MYHATSEKSVLKISPHCISTFNVKALCLYSYRTLCPKKINGFIISAFSTRFPRKKLLMNVFMTKSHTSIKRKRIGKELKTGIMK